MALVSSLLSLPLFFAPSLPSGLYLRDVGLKPTSIVVTLLSQRPSEESTDPQTRTSLLKENIEEDNITVVRRRIQVVRPWRLATDGTRAVVDTVTVGVLYLLWAP